MKYEHIEDLAYYMKQAKENGQNKPIVFLGAGASKTGDIPLAKEIIENIKTNYKNPKIGRLNEKDLTYAKLMECLTPFERNTLLKSYIDNGKINVTHLYLAHLMKEDYIDYVLTVNFDNLMLRALSLYNIFPPTYDMAVLKDLTTTTFEKGSVVYLHGQHHGLWLLNTQEEMAKVNTVIPPILNKLADKRPWIFIGYSGEDPIFNHIINLGRFDNGLYWVQYKDICPSDKVCNGLLRKENTNAFVIKNYDADSFMISLSNKLGLSQPIIIDKPFSALKEQLDNIKDIDDEKHYKDAKERLEIAKKEVNDAIEQYEKGNIPETEEMINDLNISILKKEIINLQFTTEYDLQFEEKINKFLENKEVLKNNDLKKSLAIVMLIWAYNLSNVGNKIKAFEKYNKTIELNPNIADAYNNRGVLLRDMGKKEEAFIDYNKAIDLDSNHANAYSNRGSYYLDKQNLEKAFPDCIKARDLGAPYNLSCYYALSNEKENALKYLEESLNVKGVSIEHIEKDTDWDSFRNESDFIALLNKYKS